MSHPVKLNPSFTTKSGIPITFATGTGTKWQKIKKARPEEQKSTLVPELVDQLVLALKSGYNYIDTAEIYTTHPEVAEAVKKSGVAREDVFLASKYNPGFATFKATRTVSESLDAALEELNTPYLDLYLLHSPLFTPENSKNQTIETAWKDLIAAKKAGKVRHIGVSNFAKNHLERTFAVAESPEYYPQVNQIEFHPYLQNQSEDIVAFSQKHNILVQAYGPLTPLFRITNEDDSEVKDHPLRELLPKLAAKYNRTDAQILLRWTLQKKILPVTTSSNATRIKESLEVVNFELDPEDEAAIDSAGAKFHFRGFFAQFFDNPELLHA